MLEFEQPIAELQERIHGLRILPSAHQLKIQDEIQRLEKKSLRLIKEIYQNLTPWQKVLIARHPDRPKTSNYIQRMTDSFLPLAGDRKFSDDSAIIGGLAFFKNRTIIIAGHEKGHDTESRLVHNFGMAHPEGYRKIIRLMDLADRFALPIVFLVDTSGAYAGVEAEERGQAEAIASCIEKSLKINVPIYSVIIGEGGSGGAIAMATSNYVAMLQYSVYSVISPEGCASILWRTSEKKQEAAVAQKLTAQDLKSLGIIDDIIDEPLGGGHRNKIAAIDNVANWLDQKLSSSSEAWAETRQKKFMEIGKKLYKK
jgi:acetyl-CoA carboxylase carboxyl transferase subunit alpha